MARMKDGHCRSARVCSNCRRRTTVNAGGICTACLNGEPFPDVGVCEPLTEEETPVDRGFWEWTRTAEYRQKRSELKPGRKSRPSLPSVRRLVELRASDFLEESF